MSNRFKFALLPAMLSVVMLTAGCGQKKEGNAPVDPETVPLKFSVPQIEQYTRLGKKTADGQFIVVKVHIQNTGVKAETVKPADLMLTNVTDKEEEKYTQNLEAGMSPFFAQEYGPENRDRILENAPVNINPRIQVDRYIVFMLPSHTQLDKYRLLYKPYNLEIPLITEVTVLEDRRQFNDEQ